ncbi:MAG TPA: hypothetical protein VFC47_14540 [Caulobacteraceae bacterium]|nr:hypothetical protein [Caulobacteraceae bacterium]
MRDRYALPLMAIAALALVALALVWPQGQGRRSPPPFGHALAPMDRASGVKPASPTAAP